MNYIRFITISILIVFFFGIFPQQLYAQKRIEIDLSTQRLHAYEDGILRYDFPISSGKIQTPTPQGGFWPWIKLRYDDMQGGSKRLGNYYYLPNVPYVIYFYNASFPKSSAYALHGTYWHANFGHPMSHGCVNLKTSDMAQLFPWVDILSFDKNGNGSGTIITITGNTPSF